MIVVCLPSYAAGSDPWSMAGTDTASNPGPHHFRIPRCDDGLLEVIALHTRDLVRAPPQGTHVGTDAK